MKIGFEAKRLFTNMTGLGNYSRFVVNALTDYCPENLYYLFTPRTTDHPEVASICAKKNVAVVTPSSLYKNLHMQSVWRSYGVTSDRSFKQLDVYHGLSQELPLTLPSHIKKVVTVHDLIYIRYPQFYRSIDAFIYKAKAKAARRAADTIVAVSQQTAQDIIDFLKIDASKIEVVYQGCHTNFKNLYTKEAIDQVKQKYKLPNEYILNVGTIEERKNVMVLVKALALIPEGSRPALVIMGKPTHYYHAVLEKAKSLNVLKNISFLHNVPFADFPLIYQGAKVFVYPSLFEGFGIPLIEAIESNVPVITSKGSCFSEAAGPGALYIDPTKEDELASAVTDLLGDNEKRNLMASKSKEYISRFAPKVIAQQLASLYEV